MLDIILESIRIVVVAYLLYTLIRAGEERKHFPHNGWSLIRAGFGLLLFGSLIDLTDNFESLSDYLLIGNTDVEAVLEKMVGYVGGFILIAIGLKQWLPFVAGVEELSEMAGRLATSKEELESQHAILHANEERFRAIFNSSDIAIATLHPNGQFDQVNTTYQTLLGYNANELTDLNWVELAAPEHQEASKALLYNLGTSRQSKAEIHRACWNKNGTTQLCHERLTAIRKGDKLPVFYYILLMHTEPVSEEEEVSL
ncbi:MAG: PAS domain S-box protein [Magnetococcales bacterium]|nr:PAS domain S-box protein [Magnetococcales bacterium]